MTQHDAARVERGPITEVKRFALGMADLLERQGFTVAAAELRRLHAQRDALLRVLKDCEIALRTVAKSDDEFVMARHQVREVRAAIKAVEENT